MGKFDYIKNVFSLKASIKKVISHELGDLLFNNLQRICAQNI